MGGLVLALALISSPAPAAEPTTVVSVAYTYLLPDTSIAPKGSLQLRNLDPAPHNIPALSNGRDGAPLFRSDTIGANEVAGVEGVEKLAPGVYDYTCSLHPQMLGTLTVED